MKTSKFGLPMPEGVPESDSIALAVSRLFCVRQKCPHYDVECSDGNEHTFVLCPAVAEHESTLSNTNH